MNADIQRIRDSRFFQPLPERAFDKTLKYIHVRAFQKGETVLDLGKDGEFVNYIGYVIRGRVLFLGDAERPLGVSIKDEFFLARGFTIETESVRKLISASDTTMVVFIPKMIINTLISASTDFSNLVEEIYDSIFERAKIIMSDTSGMNQVKTWLQADDPTKTLSSWVGQIEARRQKSALAVVKKKEDQKRRRWMWLAVWVSVIVLSVETLGRFYGWPFLFSPYLGLGDLWEFEAGSDFNIGIGIIGYVFVLLTSLHFILKEGIKRRKWKINYKLSSQFHILFGALGLIYVFFHSGFEFQGMNVAHFAFYCLVIGTFSGIIGQTIFNQIPKTIRGENKKLSDLKSEQKKLQSKAELLMEGHEMHKTSILFLSQGMPKSFWRNIFSAPILWFRSLRLKSSFRKLGMGGKSAQLAANLLLREYKLRQKVRMLEFSNSIFKRWMWIHKPLGFAVYILATIHVIVVTIFQ